MNKKCYLLTVSGSSVVPHTLYETPFLPSTVGIRKHVSNMDEQ